MEKDIVDEFIDKADIGTKGRFIVTAAGMIAGFIAKEAAEKTVKAFLIHRRIKID